ncbi:nucleotidyltransferase domain-containing protein [Bacillus spizizenii]|uniref:nucleotidyltransferase domain-containing protein n=1 Tax=Bacillus halotolerans TaxID=260554 RepID=UPI00227E1E8A|nr:nucleotidyltransferase domain-containing protein [Bacillus spizizenii]MCY8689882.1 nucleotidyltransferase domain-containing protein [Bacillus spizizenii]
MEKHLLITLLQKSVKEESVRLDKLKFFLFGSFGRAASPNDIDLLIMYDRDYISIEQILFLRRKIVTYSKEVIDIPMDISLLTFIEEKELNFIETEKATELIIN